MEKRPFRLKAQPRFSELRFEYVSSGQWTLTKPFMYFGDNINVVVPSGFTTDFDSVPRIPLLYAAFKGYTTQAAITHDYLYRSQAGKSQADSTFLAAMKHEGLPLRRRMPIYWGVALFGGPTYKRLGRKAL